MIDAGLPLVQCIDILAEQQQNAYFKDVLRQVRQSVEEGTTLFAALEKHPKVFDGLYTHMVEAGETGGVLDLILQRLATLIEKVVKLKRSIVSASIYPAAVVTVAIGAIAIIMIVVIPQFEQIFLGLLGPGEALPMPTRIVMGISRFLAGWGGFSTLVGLIGGAVGIRYYYKTPKGRWHIDALMLKFPIIGSILRKVAVARFSRILSTLLSSGVPILQSLDITAKTAGNVVIEDAILKVRAGVERGENFVEPLKATNVFPHMVGQMIGVGEQTGALDAMLGKIADFYEEEVDTAIADLLAMIEPVLIAFLGVTIGSIVISMYLPLFSLIGKLAGGAK
jgi:type IV pilus assembly protein PilC